MRLGTISRRGKPVTGRTINKEIATLKSMLSSAVKDEKIARNPLAGFRALESEPTKTRRALELHEVKAILKHSPPHLRLLWRAYMTTGCRRKELVELQWSDVHLDDGSITIRQSNAKGKKKRTIPLDEQLLADLAKVKRHSGHVFVTSTGTPCRNNLLREFYRICKRVGRGEPQGRARNPRPLDARADDEHLRQGNGLQQRNAVSALPFAKAKTHDHVVPCDESADDMPDSVDEFLREIAHLEVKPGVYGFDGGVSAGLRPSCVGDAVYLMKITTETSRRGGGRASDALRYICDGRSIKAEVKVGKNKPTKLQAYRLERWEKAGAIVGVVRSVDELVELLGKAQRNRSCLAEQNQARAEATRLLSNCP